MDLAVDRVWTCLGHQQKTCASPAKQKILNLNFASRTLDRGYFHCSVYVIFVSFRKLTYEILSHLGTCWLQNSSNPVLVAFWREKKNASSLVVCSILVSFSTQEFWKIQLDSTTSTQAPLYLISSVLRPLKSLIWLLISR